MIWVPLLVIAVAITACVCGSGWRERACALIVLCMAVFGYLWLGRPALPALPLAQRIDDLAARAPVSLNLNEVLALRQAMVRASPDEAAHHRALGDVLARLDRLDEAMAAYRACLRRQPDYGQALSGLASVLVRKNNGQFGSEALQLYRAALQADPTDSRAGLMIGLSLWQTGRKREARIFWADMLAAIPPDDPARQRLNEVLDTIQASPDSSPDPLPSPDSSPSPDPPPFGERQKQFP